MLADCVSTLKDIFFPALCFSCEAKLSREGYVCPRCLDKIIYLRPPTCRLCSKPLRANKTGTCQRCQRKQLWFDRVVSVAAYREPMIGLIHSFKYSHCDYLAQFLSDLMMRHLLRIGFQASQFDFVTSVPMHTLKHKSRGYNQASLLAQELAKYFKIPFRDDIIFTRQAHASQTKISVHSRLINVSNAFVANGPLPDQRILLVDDVYTTGATVNACAKALKDSGVRSVAVITLAKTI